MGSQPGEDRLMEQLAYIDIKRSFMAGAAIGLQLAAYEAAARYEHEPPGDRLTFDEATHIYYWDGQRVPNVTSIIGDLIDYSMVPAYTLEIARQKGVAVHKMIELEARGDLDEDSLPTWMRPVLAEWRRFIIETGFVVIASEQRVYHPKLGYAGTYDLKGKFTILKLQHGRPPARFALKLRENEPYRLEPYDDPNDFNVFTACLIRHKWQEVNQL